VCCVHKAVRLNPRLHYLYHIALLVYYCYAIYSFMQISRVSARVYSYVAISQSNNNMLGTQFVYNFNGKIKFLNYLNLLILPIIWPWFGNFLTLKFHTILTVCYCVLKKYTGTFLSIIVWWCLNFKCIVI